MTVPWIKKVGPPHMCQVPFGLWVGEGSVWQCDDCGQAYLWGYPDPWSEEGYYLQWRPVTLTKQLEEGK